MRGFIVYPVFIKSTIGEENLDIHISDGGGVKPAHDPCPYAYGTQRVNLLGWRDPHVPLPQDGSPRYPLGLF